MFDPAEVPRRSGERGNVRKSSLGVKNVTVARLDRRLRKPLVRLGEALEMRRPSFFGMACIVIVIAAAQVLPFLDLADPELASADSVIAGIVAKAVLIGERFPI